MTKRAELVAAGSVAETSGLDVEDPLARYERVRDRLDFEYENDLTQVRTLEELEEVFECMAGNWVIGRFPHQCMPEGLPPFCPVRPLGHDGDVYYFLDTAGQLRAVPDDKFSKNKVMSLFMGCGLYLLWAWPQVNSKEQVDNWKNDHTVRDLMAACKERGPWSPADRVRGRGCWWDEDEGLIVHTGKSVLIGGMPCQPGDVGKYVYPTRPGLAEPWGFDMSSDDTAPKVLWPLLKTWNWRRPELDPLLMMGWIGAAMLGGALGHRPAVYVTADRGTGKSTLQGVIKRFLNGYAVEAADTTAAGIYQTIGHDSLAVMLDEFEGEANSAKKAKVVELMRAAFSGATMRRGGDSHKATQFELRSAFLFSSINTPPLSPADRSRMAILTLREANGVMPSIDGQQLSRSGLITFRMLIGAFDEILSNQALWRERLAAVGHDGRGQDAFGTLLAVATVMMGWGNLGPTGILTSSEITRLLSRDALSELEDIDDNWAKCLGYLLSVEVDAWRNNTSTSIGQLLDGYLSHRTDRPVDFQTLETQLPKAGVRVIKRDGGDWLFIQNNHPKLHALFQGSEWAGTPTQGGWSNALRQAPEDVWCTHQTRVGGVNGKGTLLSLAQLRMAGGVLGEGADG